MTELRIHCQFLHVPKRGPYIGQAAGLLCQLPIQAHPAVVVLPVEPHGCDPLAIVYRESTLEARLLDTAPNTDRLSSEPEPHDGKTQEFGQQQRWYWD